MESMPQAFIVDAVVREVRRLEGYPDLSVLDLSCGEGEVLSRLAADGCRVRGTHFRDDGPPPRGLSRPLRAGPELRGG